MSFIDEAKIKVIAGKGGDGIVSFRRERFIAKGGPDGGDGGNGGSIFARVNPNLNTLSLYRRKKQFKAQNGENGGRNTRKGKKGEDLVIQFPKGTLIRLFKKEDKKLILEKIIDLMDKKDEILFAKGGIGGHGNDYYKSSCNQTPRKRQLGKKGETKFLELELKLIADIGLVGLPNSGKSTLLSRISHARPKIADYPFTTLEPSLGVIEFDELGIKERKSLVVADIPGLIEGAHQGKGLGDRFLRHVDRCKALIHLIDITSDNIRGDYQAINRELKNYSPKLAKKKQVVVLNKIDLLPEEKRKKKLKILRKKIPHPLFPISAVTGEGIKELFLSLIELK